MGFFKKAFENGFRLGGHLGDNQNIDSKISEPGKSRYNFEMSNPSVALIISGLFLFFFFFYKREIILKQCF